MKKYYIPAPGSDRRGVLVKWTSPFGISKYLSCDSLSFAFRVRSDMGTWLSWDAHIEAEINDATKWVEIPGAEVRARTSAAAYGGFTAPTISNWSDAAARLRAEYLFYITRHATIPLSETPIPKTNHKIGVPKGKLP